MKIEVAHQEDDEKIYGDISEAHSPEKCLSKLLATYFRVFLSCDDPTFCLNFAWSRISYKGN